MNDLEALERASRLEQMGIAIRSVELMAAAKAFNQFHANGGNRKFRRAAKRAARKRGR